MLEFYSRAGELLRHKATENAIRLLQRPGQSHEAIPWSAEHAHKI